MTSPDLEGALLTQRGEFLQLLRGINQKINSGTVQPAELDELKEILETLDSGPVLRRFYEQDPLIQEEMISCKENLERSIFCSSPSR